MKRKWICMVSAIAMTVALLSGCGSQGEASSSSAAGTETNVSESEASASQNESAAESAKGPYKIVYITRVAGDSYWDSLARGATMFGEDTGNEVINMAPSEYDSALQLNVLQDAITLQPDAICITPISNDACEPLLKQAKDAGIVVVTSEGLGMENSDWEVVGLNSANYGKHIIEEMAESMGGEGDYIMMAGSLANTGHMSRINAAIAYQEETYPNMHCLDVVAPAGDSADEAVGLFSEILMTYPSLKAIFAHQSTAQAALAVEQAGKIDDVYVIGYSMPEEAGQYLESGAMDLSVIGDPNAKAAAQCAVAVAVLNGEEIKEGMDLGYNGFDAIICDPSQKLIEANSFIDITAENWKDFSF